MISRLPKTSKREKKLFTKFFLVLLASSGVFSVLLFFLFFRPVYFSADFAVSDFFAGEREGKPAFYATVKNYSFRPKRIFAEVFFEDKIHFTKRVINLGEFGELFPQEEKTYEISWEKDWQGWGGGEVKLVVRDEEGKVAEKSFPLAVLPFRWTQFGMASLIFSSILGVGFFLSRFV